MVAMGGLQVQLDARRAALARIADAVRRYEAKKPPAPAPAPPPAPLIELPCRAWPVRRGMALAGFLVEENCAWFARSGPTVAAIKVREIAKMVAQGEGITVGDIMGERRAWPIARPRQIVMYLATKYTGMSLVRIGKLLGGKDHTTVLHAKGRIAELIKSDPIIAFKVERYAKQIEARSSFGSIGALEIRPS